MVANGYALKWHWVWNDIYVSQFKSSKPWFFVSKYPNMTWGCKMLWNFFKNERGKGPHDGARAVIKRFLCREQLDAHGAKLQNAKEMVGFLRKHLSKRLETSFTCVRKPLQ